MYTILYYYYYDYIRVWRLLLLTRLSCRYTTRVVINNPYIINYLCGFALLLGLLTFSFETRLLINERYRFSRFNNYYLFFFSTTDKNK